MKVGPPAVVCCATHSHPVPYESNTTAAYVLRQIDPLATGLLPLADGSDLGGSLRNPANFNNIVALRPTVGLVPVAAATSFLKSM